MLWRISDRSFVPRNGLWGAPPWCSGSVLDHRSLPPVFESRRGHIWRLFHLSLRLITFGGRSAHLAYYVHKSGRKTAIIIIIILTVCGRPIVRSNGCETIDLRFIDVRKKLVVTGSVPLGDLWPAGCWDRTGVDVVAVGFGWVWTVFTFSWCGLNVWKLCQWMFVMVQPSQRRLDQLACEYPLDNTLIVLGRGGISPVYTGLDV